MRAFGFLNGDHKIHRKLHKYYCSGAAFNLSTVFRVESNFLYFLWPPDGLVHPSCFSVKILAHLCSDAAYWWTGTHLSWVKLCSSVAWVEWRWTVVTWCEYLLHQRTQSASLRLALNLVALFMTQLLHCLLMMLWLSRSTPSAAIITVLSLSASLFNATGCRFGVCGEP